MVKKEAKEKRSEKNRVSCLCPHYKRGILRRRLTELESTAPFKSKFKYVESAGKSLIAALGNLDPWATPCGRERCFTCRSEPAKCMTQGIVYEIDCKICQRAGLEVKYYGETARTSFNRGIEHLNALDKHNKESPLVEHQEEDHPNVPP